MTGSVETLSIGCPLAQSASVACLGVRVSIPVELHQATWIRGPPLGQSRLGMRGPRSIDYSVNREPGILITDSDPSPNSLCLPLATLWTLNNRSD
jgi:hypothetical protein